MHIEPGVVDPSKLWLGFTTAAAAGGYALMLARREVSARGIGSVAARTLVVALLVLGIFEALPHPPVGVSEVHLILGSTLFLVFGAAPASLGLAIGLLAQGLLFEPADLPQYGMNVTTLLVPLFGIAALAARTVPPRTAYIDLRYSQVAAMSATYQVGIIAWVAFWSLYGQGLGAHTLAGVAQFGAAYLAVVLIEPLVDLAVLATAKTLRGGSLVCARLHAAA